MDKIIAALSPVSQLDARLLRRRKPLYHPDFPFIILWSHKAACTPVAKWFFLQIGMLNEDMLKGVRVHFFERTYKSQPGYLENLCAELKLGRKPVIKFVRDPYARAYSSYLEICSDSVLNPNYWGFRTRQQIISDLAGSAHSIDYTFSFCDYLHWLGRQDMQALNAHIRPQHLARDKFMTIRLVRIEALSDNLARLESEFSLQHSIDKNRTILDSPHFHKKSSTFDKSSAQRLLELGVPIRKPPDFPYVKFDAELARGTKYEDLVGKCFRQDIKLYGY
jgi:hypothetical protein